MGQRKYGRKMKVLVLSIGKVAGNIKELEACTSNIIFWYLDLSAHS